MGRTTPGVSRRVVRLALLAPLAALLALGARAGFRAYRLERTLVFQPHPPGHLTPAECGLPGAADVEYGRSEGAPLRGWYVPSRNGAAIVFVHGAGGDHTALVREAALLRGAGYGVLLIDLPGEGASGGHITAGRNEEAAVESAIDWLAHHGATRIGALAFSLGSSFLARVAADDARVRAVVLEAASSSNIDRIRATQGDRAWLTTLPATLAWYQEGTSPWRAPPTEAVGAIAPRPLLLITGLRDAWASPGMARELAARAGPTARVELFDSGHGGFWEAEPARYVALLLSFFATALGT